MAKFSLEFDTVTKQATATMDGVAVDNLGDLCLFRSGGRGTKAEYHLEMVQRTHDEANDTVTYTRTMAHEQAVASLGRPGAPVSDVIADIRRYFSAE